LRARPAPRRAIQLDPKNAHRYYNRGIAYSSKGDHDRAIQDYDRAIELDPKYGIAYDNRGYSYASKGNLDRAIQDYDQAIQLDPKMASPTSTAPARTPAKVTTVGRCSSL
jgi:tetratricopeptide (TPR) repeat protein